MEKRILLSHGEGGRRTHELISKVILKYFTSPELEQLADSAILPLPDEGKLVFTTDSHVVDPIFFPGGDIGRLAVCGTVNDLAVCGATPRFLSVGLILEEGFLLKDLERVLASARDAADEVGARIVTGDTKVVSRGQADKIYINTAGVGFRPLGVDLGAHRISVGDKLLVSGQIGQHGAAIMSRRLDLDRQTTIESDVAPIVDVCQAAVETGGVKAIRDATRGGMATVLNEFAQKSGFVFTVEESRVPVSSQVVNLCEVIGAEPHYLANEGTAVLIVAQTHAQSVLEALRKTQHGQNAAIIGDVTQGSRGEVRLQTAFGTQRMLDMLSGGQFPRIC